MGYEMISCGPAPHGVGPADEWERHIALFRAQTAGPLPERRREVRYPAVECPVWVGWWVGARDFRIAPARLENVSRGGALIVLSDPPPTRDAVWICLGVPEPLDCARATVLEVRPLGSEQAARLAFPAPCSDLFFRTAVRGLAREARREALACGPEE